MRPILRWAPGLLVFLFVAALPPKAFAQNCDFPPCSPVYQATCDFGCGSGGDSCTFYYCPNTYADEISYDEWCGTGYNTCVNTVCYYSPGYGGWCCTDTSVCCSWTDQWGYQQQKTEQTGSIGPCQSSPP